MFSADALAAWTEQYYWPFLRLSALLIASPVFSAASVPVRVRVLLTVVITALVAPSIPPVVGIDPLGPSGFDPVPLPREPHFHEKDS